MDKKQWLKSILISMVICLAAASFFSLAIILQAPKRVIQKPAQAQSIKADSDAVIPRSLLGTWQFTSPKLGHALITLEKDGTIRFKSNGMNILGKYSIQIKEKTIILDLSGIVDGTVTLTGEMTAEEKLRWNEIKGWDLGNPQLEWSKK